MKAFFSINAGLITLAMFSAAQENIPDAAPIADGPLVANPELDTLDMADMLYKQAQAPATKENRQEYGRLLDLSLRKYLEFTQRFPQSTQAPLAEYRAAMFFKQFCKSEVIGFTAAFYIVVFIYKQNFHLFGPAFLF